VLGRSAHLHQLKAPQGPRKAGTPYAIRVLAFLLRVIVERDWSSRIFPDRETFALRAAA